MKATTPLHPSGRGARRPRPDGPHARALFSDAGTRACARARHGGGAWPQHGAIQVTRCQINVECLLSLKQRTYPNHVLHAYTHQSGNHVVMDLRIC
jgi:hypothetical protein